MFENLNTTLTPRLQSSHSVPHLCRPADAPGSVEPSGTGLWVGSGQHLKNLGRAVGAKVNDFLRRREPWGLGSVGAMAVNRTAEAQLAGGADGKDERSALQEAFPRLDPPPPVTRKRTPRALKTTQDMLISAQPVLSSLECGAEASPGRPGPADASQPEAAAGTLEGGEALPNGEVSLSVPDLLHQDSQDEPRLQTTEGGRAASPGPVATNGRKVSAAEALEDSSPRARASSLEKEGPHPDLLSFE